MKMCSKLVSRLPGAGDENRPGTSERLGDLIEERLIRRRLALADMIRLAVDVVVRTGLVEDGLLGRTGTDPEDLCRVMIDPDADMRVRNCGRRHHSTTIRLSRLVTPGTERAALSARPRSCQELTAPFRITRVPMVSTSTFSALMGEIG